MAFVMTFEKKEAACFTYNRFRDYVKHTFRNDLERQWPQRRGSCIIVQDDTLSEAQRFADKISAQYSVERV
jgi:hypothetical protein